MLLIDKDLVMGFVMGLQEAGESMCPVHGMKPQIAGRSRSHDLVILREAPLPSHCQCALHAASQPNLTLRQVISSVQCAELSNGLLSNVVLTAEYLNLDVFLT